MSITVTNGNTNNPTYNLFDVISIDQPESNTYNYTINNNNAYVTINNNLTVIQTGSISYENVANTQTVKLFNNNNLTNTSVDFQSIGTKKFDISDNTIFNTTTMSGNGIVYVGNDSKLNITTCSGSGTINVGCDENFNVKNGSILTITTPGSYVINVYGNNCIINVSNCTNLTIKSNAYNTLINGTNNIITNESNSISTQIIGTQTSVTDNGTSTQNVTTGQTAPILTQSTFGNININNNTISTTNTNGNLNISPNGTGIITSSNKVTVTDTTPSTSSSSGALVLSGGLGVDGNINNSGTINGRNIITDGSTLDAYAISKENVSNKAINFNVINNTLYPTVSAVNTQVQGLYSVLNSSLAYWDGLNSPFIANNSSPLGTAAGAAVFLSNTEGVRLTLAGVNNSSGSINFNFQQLNAMRTQFSFKTTASGGVGTGADATWFYLYTDAVATTEFGSGITKGYIISFSEYHDQICLNWGNGSDYNGTAYSNTLAFNNAYTDIDDGTWKDVDILIIYNRIQVYYKTIKVLDFVDVYNRDLTGSNFGFGARTGGITATHQIKNFVVLKLGNDPSVFNINNVTPINSGMNWDRQNSRLGININAPTQALDVLGNIKVSSAIICPTLFGNVLSGNNLTLQPNNANTTTGSIIINSTTSSTSTSTGSLRVLGGVGLAGAIFGGSTASFATSLTSPIIYGNTLTTTNLTLQPNSADATTGSVIINSTSSSTSSTTGSLRVLGGFGLSGDLFGGSNASFATSLTSPIIRGSTNASGTLTINSTSSITKPTAGIIMNDGIASTGVGSGTLVITGGLGLSGALFGGITASFATSLTSPTIFGNTTSGTNLTLQPNNANTTTGSVIVNSSLVSTSSTTGSLRVLGGFGLSGDLFGGSNATFATSLTSPIIRGSTNASGTLTINSTSSGTKAVAGILMNDGIASTGTGSGTLVITGGLGVSGDIFGGSTASFTTSLISPTIAGSTITSNNLIIRPNTTDLTTGSVQFTNTIDSNASTGSGSIQIAGGVGIAKKLYIGTDLSVTNLTTLSGATTISGAITLGNNITSNTLTNTITGGSNVIGLTIIGSTASGGNLVLNSTTNATKGNVQITETTISNSSISGALLVSGGVGVAGALNVGNISLNSSTNTISTTSGDLSLNSTTGNILVPTDPIVNLGISSKQYVDNIFTRTTDYCTTDQNVSNSTALVNSTYINGFPLVVGTYRINGTIFFTSTATTGIRLAFVLSTATDSNARIMINKLSGTVSYQNMIAMSTAPTVPTNAATGLIQFASIANEVGTILIDGTVEITLAGTIALQYAQNTANAANTTLRRGSFITFTKII